MKKKFVLTLALVLMVAVTLTAATPLEVSGSFKAGYKFSFSSDGNAITNEWKTGSAASEVETLVSVSSDFWKVSFGGNNVDYADDAAVEATADLYLNKALAEQGVDMGDVALTLHLGNGVSAAAPSVLTDRNDFRKNDGSKVGMKTTGNNFGLTVGYSDLVKVYFTMDPTKGKATPLLVGATVTPIDGVKVALGFTNDYTAVADSAMTVSAAVDIAELADLDFDLAVTAEGIFNFDDSAVKPVIAANAAGAYEGIGLWVAYYKTGADVHKLAAKASYETKIEDFTVGAGVKISSADVSKFGDNYALTLDASGKYAMGGVTYSLAAAYTIKGAFTLTPTVAFSF